MYNVYISNRYLIGWKGAFIFKKRLSFLKFESVKMVKIVCCIITWPLFSVHKNIFSCWPFFGYVLTILALTKCRLVTKHVLSITHSHSCFFLTFSLTYNVYNKFKLSIKYYLLLIYTIMCMIIFLRIIILSFQSHQLRILSAGLVMAWNRGGLFCNSVCL